MTILPDPDTPAQVQVAAFYRFLKLEDLASLQTSLLALCQGHDLCGMVLIADEGINGTIAGAPAQVKAALAAIANKIGTPPLDVKYSTARSRPFLRMKVRIKKEIVTIGDAAVDPVKRVGTYVDPKDWNALILDPDVVVIDTRNGYEVEIGTFKGALDPKTRAFGQFPDYVRQTLDPTRHRKVAMFCTGGIRCEKASSFMLSEGFEEVYHLKGGILNYLENIPSTDSLWTGGCFVFDERVAVGHDLEVLPVRLCLSCNAPIDEDAMASLDFEEGVSCPRCISQLSEDKKASSRERQKQVLLAEKQGRRHLGPK
jgi:UPF0176 protein